MGLFDSIAGQVLGSLGSAGDGKHAGMIDAIGGLLNSPQVGGISGLVKTFEQNGLGSTVASWIGTGANLPISPEQLQSVLGNSQVAAIAQKLGISPQDVSTHLAEYLPQIIDKLTPNGAVPDNNALSGLLGMLKGKA
jgi:uncharacterized protein YidB (DUF937 family)